jgi:type I restriction-modification system DNA methylase subunit
MFIADISGCGAGVFLISALQEVRERYGPRLAKTITLIGCDLDPVTCQVARASLILAGAEEDQFWIACGNSLARPIVGRDRADGQLKTLNFPLLLGNPPFGTATKMADLELAAQAGPLVVPDRVLNRAFVVSAHEKALLADAGQRPIHRAVADADGRLFSGFDSDELLAA